MKFRRILSILLVVVLIVGSIFTWNKRQDITDWYALKNYSPPAEVVKLADNIQMTDKARKIFYINKPKISDETEFLSACSKEAAIVLGCYISGDGIYIFNVTDKRLNGVKEVTASHEMLHAAYERLSGAEKQRIDNLTNKAFSDLKNQRIIDNVERYRREDPSVVPNELHSILPTEVRDLPKELEEYYRQYFKNRSKVVDLSDGYEEEFESRKETFANITKRLESMKKQIEQDEKELESDYNELKIEQSRLDSLLSSGDVAEYNTAIPAFNRQVNAYNNSVNSVKNLINDYNNLVKQAKSLQVEINQLVNALDSSSQKF